MRKTAVRYAALLIAAPALLLASGCVSPGRTLQAELDKVFDSPRFANGFWGVRIERLDGTALYDRNGHRNFTPASNMKLYTTAAALDILGAGFTYETKLEAVGTISPDGVLDGDLVITGSGDPSLGAWHPDKDRDSRWLLRRWVAKIKDAGVREVRGGIVGDGRCFTREYYCSDWTYDDLIFWYGAGSSGLAIEENAYRITIRAGSNVGDPATISWTPPTDYINVINEAKTVAAGQENTADSVLNQTEGNTRRVAGNIAIDKKIIEERGSVWDGARYAAHLLREELVRQGVAVKGEAVNIRSLTDVDRIDKADAAKRKLITTYQSPPLSELVKVVNKPSHNFFADQIQRTLGLKKRGEGSFSAGAKAVQEWLSGIGAPESDAFAMFDGSGLARGNLVQPRQTCHLLRHMRGATASAAFYDSLPIAGVDGTISSRMKAGELKGKLRAKTGYISSVRSLSGYVTDADGQELVFSMMCNHYTVPTAEVNAAQDKACLLLARFAEKPKRK